MLEQNNIKIPNKKARLIQFQLGELQGYLNAGITNKSELARKLKVSRGTIYNELARGTTTQVKKIYLYDAISCGNRSSCNKSKRGPFL